MERVDVRDESRSMRMAQRYSYCQLFHPDAWKKSVTEGLFNKWTTEAGFDGPTTQEQFLALEKLKWRINGDGSVALPGVYTWQSAAALKLLDVLDSHGAHFPRLFRLQMERQFNLGVGFCMAERGLHCVHTPPSDIGSIWNFTANITMSMGVVDPLQLMTASNIRYLLQAGVREGTATQVFWTQREINASEQHPFIAPQSTRLFAALLLNLARCIYILGRACRHIRSPDGTLRLYQPDVDDRRKLHIFSHNLKRCACDIDELKLDIAFQFLAQYNNSNTLISLLGLCHSKMCTTKEMRSNHHHKCFNPNCDKKIDPRTGENKRKSVCRRCKENNLRIQAHYCSLHCHRSDWAEHRLVHLGLRIPKTRTDRLRHLPASHFLDRFPDPVDLELGMANYDLRFVGDHVLNVC